MTIVAIGRRLAVPASRRGQTGWQPNISEVVIASPRSRRVEDNATCYQRRFQKDNILVYAGWWTAQGQVREGFARHKLKLESGSDSIDLWTPDPE